MDGPDPQKVSDMLRFDALPFDVRRAMSSAAFQFHPATAEKLLRRGASGERVGEILKAADHGCYVKTEPSV